jgi:putative transcriptional regulator
MGNNKKYRSDVFAAVHEMATDLYEVGAIDKKTLREYDEITFAPISAYTPEEIRKIRANEGVSQAVFANYLNVNKSLVSQWERGEKKPAGPSLKLLSLVQKNGLKSIL